MADRLVKVAAVSYEPAVKEVLPIPARCVSVQVRRPRTRGTDGGSRAPVSPAGVSGLAGIASFINSVTSFLLDNKSPEYGLPPTVSSGGYGGYESTLAGISGSTVSETTGTDVVCFPGRPGVQGSPGVVTTDQFRGWNAGAKSRKIVGSDAVVAFDIPRTAIGVIVGLADATPDPSFNGITHGVLYTGSTIRLVERGVETVDTGITPSPNTRVIISRVEGRVTYHVGDWVYTSSVASVGAATLDALLFLSGDYIDSPTIADAVSLQARSAWEWRDSVSGTAMRADSAWGWASSVTLGDGRCAVDAPVIFRASEAEYSRINVVAAEPRVSAAAGFINVETTGIVLSIPSVMNAIGVTIGAGGFADTLPVNAKLSEPEYSYMGGEVASLRATGIQYDEAPGTTTSAEVVVPLDFYTFDPSIFASYTDTIEVGTVIDVLIAIDAALADFLALSDTTSVALIIDALVSAGVQFTDNASLAQRYVLQYATDVISGAVTRFQGFDFSGFVYTGERTYGWKKDGLFLVDGSEDAGQPISALVEFAATDLGDTNRKTLDAIYFGVDTDGQMYVRLTDDYGYENQYQVVSRNNDYRAVPARGLASRFWRAQLQVVDASMVELNHIEWVSGTSGRRTKR